jgi:hypothetical protein
MAALIGKKAAKVSISATYRQGGTLTNSMLHQSVLAKHIAAIEPLDPLYETTIDSKGKAKRVRVGQL